MRLSFLPGLLLLILLLGSTSLQAQSFEQSYRKGSELALKGSYVEAILAFDEALAYDPHSADAYYNRGYCKAQLKQLEYAIEDFNAALKIYDDFPEPLYWRGRCYLSMSKYPEAIQDLSSALALDTLTRQENKDDMLFYRGMAYMLDKKYKPAITDFSSALHANPKNMQALKNRALSCYQLNALPAASQDLDKYCAVYPSDAQALQVNMDVKYRLGDMDNAFALAKRFTALGHEAEIGYSVMANINFMRKNYEEAIQNCTDAVNANPDFAMAYYTRGGCYAALKQNDKACKDFSKAGQLGYPGSSTLAKQYCQ